jgi:hypothetical protein
MGSVVGSTAIIASIIARAVGVGAAEVVTRVGGTLGGMASGAVTGGPAGEGASVSQPPVRRCRRSRHNRSGWRRRRGLALLVPAAQRCARLGFVKWDQLDEAVVVGQQACCGHPVRVAIGPLQPHVYAVVARVPGA